MCNTTLYIPIGSWDAYAYDDNWYLFHNIRETATEEEQLSMQHAYTMMDTEAFTYSVYDPVNNRISTISSIGIDENNPNHSWQVIEEGGNRYLYNMGTKIRTLGSPLMVTSSISRSMVSTSFAVAMARQGRS